MRKLIVIIAMLALPSALLQAQDDSSVKPEFGFWVGASSPMPGTKTEEVLESSMGGGLFLRMKWPWVFHTELGLSYANYLSRFSQSLTIVPVYGALSYRLPLTFQLQIFLKLGGGATWVQIEPKTRSKWGWDPLFYAGVEFSIRAGRKLRIGLRLDHNYVYEKHLKPPPEVELLKYLGTRDPRYAKQNEFTLENGSFFNFGLMLSFFL